MRYYLRYVKGLTTAEEKASLRYGSAWHSVLEILSLTPGDVCRNCAKAAADPDCPICCGTDTVPEDTMDAAIRFLTKVYNEKEGMDPDRARLEYTQILYAANMYRHLYGDDTVGVKTEADFSLPLPSGSGRALPDVNVIGFIDKIVPVEAAKAIMEHKTTSKSIEPDSDYWNHLRLDTQISLYTWAAARLFPGDIISGVYYDVFHKPGINPCKLTQKGTKDFIETGQYHGVDFEVEVLEDQVKVNGEQAEVHPGKKEDTFAIRETMDMYGIRLMADIAERPGFYFQRREIARTADDLVQFEKELRNIYYSIRNMERSDCWFRNESQCQATFKCEFCELCYNGIEVGDEVPEGYVKTSSREKSNGVTTPTQA